MIKRYLEFIKEAESLETISTKNRLKELQDMVQKYKSKKKEFEKIYSTSKDEQEKNSRLKKFWDEDRDEISNELLNKLAPACVLKRKIQDKENEKKTVSDQERLRELADEISKLSKEAKDEEKLAVDKLKEMEEEIKNIQGRTKKDEIEAKSVPATTTP